jgi:hypothetical protein
MWQVDKNGRFLTSSCHATVSQIGRRNEQGFMRRLRKLRAP